MLVRVSAAQIVPTLSCTLNRGTRRPSGLPNEPASTWEGPLRSWQEVGGERKDMYMYSRLPN
jgi:hypothetical protein